MKAAVLVRELLRTGQRSVIKLPKTLAPKDVAPYTDAGLTAYRAAKKASRHLLPSEYAVVIGAGGLGHIGICGISAILNHPWIPSGGADAITVRGFIYDVDTGKLDEVSYPEAMGSFA